MGKGSARRKCQTGHEEETLRWKFAFGKITSEKFHREYARLEHEGKITRGRLSLCRGFHI